MRRRVDLAAFVLAAATAATAAAVDLLEPFGTRTVGARPVGPLAVKGLLAVAVVAALYGGYRLVLGVASSRLPSKRRRHDLRNVLRLAAGAVGVVAVLGVFTAKWIGVLVSLGVVGLAVTFALQQPLLSLPRGSTSRSRGRTPSATGSRWARPAATSSPSTSS